MKFTYYMLKGRVDDTPRLLYKFNGIKLLTYDRNGFRESYVKSDVYGDRCPKEEFERFPLRYPEISEDEFLMWTMQ